MLTPKYISIALFFSVCLFSCEKGDKFELNAIGTKKMTLASSKSKMDNGKGVATLKLLGRGGMRLTNAMILPLRVKYISKSPFIQKRFYITSISYKWSGTSLVVKKLGRGILSRCFDKLTLQNGEILDGKVPAPFMRGNLAEIVLEGLEYTTLFLSEKGRKKVSQAQPIQLVARLVISFSKLKYPIKQIKIPKSKPSEESIKRYKAFFAELKQRMKEWKDLPKAERKRKIAQLKDLMMNTRKINAR